MAKILEIYDGEMPNFYPRQWSRYIILTDTGQSAFLCKETCSTEIAVQNAIEPSGAETVMKSLRDTFERSTGWELKSIRLQLLDSIGNPKNISRFIYMTELSDCYVNGWSESYEWGLQIAFKQPVSNYFDCYIAD
jgi:hypothetical protein